KPWLASVPFRPMVPLSASSHPRRVEEDVVPLQRRLEGVGHPPHGVAARRPPSHLPQLLPARLLLPLRQVGAHDPPRVLRLAATCPIFRPAWHRFGRTADALGRESAGWQDSPGGPARGWFGRRRGLPRTGLAPRRVPGLGKPLSAEHGVTDTRGVDGMTRT